MSLIKRLVEIDSDYEQVEAILAEAERFGLRAEVHAMAIGLMNEQVDILTAYQIAFDEWVK